jgi:asparagine synthase (glutamine-hydrolysing)
MCGIIVSTSKEQDALSLRETLNKRGPDQSKLIKVDDISFSFHRLAIMDLDETGMQPFQYKGCTIVANAEIYNYKEIKEQVMEYEYVGDSDCEVLLPFYQVFKEDFFQYLDAEFAIVLYDSNTKSVIAGRDPIGIRPLFYGYHRKDEKIMFASEAKALFSIVTKVFPFPPGHYYKDGVFTKYSTINDVASHNDHLLHEISDNIKSKLTKGVTKRINSDAPMGYLLSGGLDSSLVCSIASKYSKEKIRTFAIGMDQDPIDLKYAKEVADYLGTNHTEVSMNKEEVLGSLDEVIYALETYDITTIRASIAMYILAKYIHENTDIKVLLTGEVSDELFGYKYTDFAPDPIAFQNESIKRVDELYMYDVLRADRCLAANSLEARVPFADLDFASYVLRIPPFFKMNRYKMGKFLLRNAFDKGYLPQSILYRDKAAFSDAVGHSMVDYLKEFAENKYTDKEFESKRYKYKPIPISKEALLYRDTFEKHYPMHGHLIVDYWMPNKEWKGCNVDDPSARVLSNYGKSGK